jgi:hypothetical protein
MLLLMGVGGRSANILDVDLEELDALAVKRTPNNQVRGFITVESLANIGRNFDGYSLC